MAFLQGLLVQAAPWCYKYGTSLHSQAFFVDVLGLMFISLAPHLCTLPDALYAPA